MQNAGLQDLPGFGLAIAAFHGTSEPPPAGPVANGAIAFSMLSGSGWQIFTINPDGTGLTKLTDLATDQIQPTWSPDGARIAFVAQGEGGRTQIEVMNADGSNLQTLTEGRGWNYLPDWSHRTSWLIRIAGGAITHHGGTAGQCAWSTIARLGAVSRNLAGSRGLPSSSSGSGPG